MCVYKLVANSAKWRVPMPTAKCAAELGKIIKYSKNMWENELNFTIFTIILMAAFGSKNVHSAVGLPLTDFYPTEKYNMLWQNMFRDICKKDHKIF